MRRGVTRSIKMNCRIGQDRIGNLWNMYIDSRAFLILALALKTWTSIMTRNSWFGINSDMIREKRGYSTAIAKCKSVAISWISFMCVRLKKVLCGVS